MHANKGKQPSRGHNFNMAPLFARLEESISRINEKLASVKRRNSEEEPASEQSHKQARTYADASQPKTPLRQGDTAADPITFSGSPQHRATRSLGQASQFNPATPTRHQYRNWSTAGYSVLHPSPGPGLANPIDVTTGSSFANPIDLTTAPNSPSSVGTMADDAQMQTDEAIARALQDAFARDASDLQDMSVDTNVSGLSDQLGLAFDPSIFKRHLREMRCAKCRNAMPICWETLVSRTAGALMRQNKLHPLASCSQDLPFLHPYLQCNSCKQWSCCGLGCDKYLAPSNIDRTIHFSNPHLRLTWCCDASRLFLIFSLACGPEQPSKVPVPIPGPSTPRNRFKPSSEGSPASAHEPQTHGKTITGLSKEKSIGKMASHFTGPKWRHGKEPESKLSKGTGYGGAMSYRSRSDTTGEAQRREVAKRIRSENGKMEQYLWALAALLPSYSRDEATLFDYSPQPMVAFMLARSPILTKVTELLRQNSVEEMGSSLSLYAGILELLDAMAGHTDIIPLLYQDQVCYPRAEQLPCFTFERAKDTPGGSHPPPEKTQSLDTLMQRLSGHCDYFVRTASMHIEHFETEGEQQLLLLARQIIDLAEKLNTGREAAFVTAPTETASANHRDDAPELAAPTVTTRASSRRAAQSKAKEDAAAWHREHCVEEIPDDKILESFAFHRQAKAIENSKFAPGRMRKLVQQIASLRTSVAEGIYVRHGSSRLDVIKILMVGPSGTPYENGLFEFDMFCPAEFPKTPPLMNFRTTGGGSVRFNPNLYACGKVCLSLLGTWQGQSWESDKSTILQILISIQGMILNDQPWYNEPGREYHLDNQQAKQYNQTIWGYTLEHAMIQWLATPAVSRKSSQQGKLPEAQLSGIHNQPPENQPKVTWSGPPSWLSTFQDLPIAFGTKSTASESQVTKLHPPKIHPPKTPIATAQAVPMPNPNLLAEPLHNPNLLAKPLPFVVGAKPPTHPATASAGGLFSNPGSLFQGHPASSSVDAQHPAFVNLSNWSGFGLSVDAAFKKHNEYMASLGVKLPAGFKGAEFVDYASNLDQKFPPYVASPESDDGMFDPEMMDMMLVAARPSASTMPSKELWAEVIRQHFSQGHAILQSAKRSTHYRSKNGAELIKRLEDCLREKGFI
ncbi:hypothetical protein B0T16DRAFT_406156 [Cercophora newfieldiana]|uniref:UBC core domain-containing protein n=1 Tax=Cercophora newfieldiana TaxID=92897 RepID=A0AA39YGW6_9PEZI|nr:hypothetical protein B0T16DRAFT_406156 [Cercophora newfieldiana]